MKLIKWNSEYWKSTKISVWKFEPDISDSFGEILSEKPQNLQRVYELINVLPPSNFAKVANSLNLPACKESSVR